MKELWLEYKKWVEQIIPGGFGKVLWDKNFEKYLLVILLIGIGYLVSFIIFGDKILHIFF